MSAVDPAASGEHVPGDKPYYEDGSVTLWLGHALEVLCRMAAGSVDECVTSVPYFNQRDYGAGAGEIGAERTVAEYLEALVAVFVEVRRVLREDGTLWLNIDDTYSGKANGGPTFDRHRGAGHGAGIVARRVNTLDTAPYKALLGIPWRLVFALQDAGWTLRNDIVWNKPNCTPESVRDRLTRRYEHLFLFSKGPRYYFDLDAIRVPHAAAAVARAADHRAPSGLLNADHPSDTAKPMQTSRMRHPNGANPGDVWEISNTGYPEAHFATFPLELPRRCILAGSKPGDLVLDPFNGAATTGVAARGLGRRYVGIDLKADYLDLSIKRFAQGVLDLEVSA